MTLIDTTFEHRDVTVTLTSTGEVYPIGSVRACRSDLPLAERDLLNEECAISAVKTILERNKLPVPVPLKFQSAFVLVVSSVVLAQYPEQTTEFRKGRCESLAKRIVRELGLNWMAERQQCWGQDDVPAGLAADDRYTLELVRLLNRPLADRVLHGMLGFAIGEDVALPLVLGRDLTPARAYRLTQRLRVVGCDVLVRPDTITRYFAKEVEIPPADALWGVLLAYDTGQDRATLRAKLAQALGCPLEDERVGASMEALGARRMVLVAKDLSFADALCACELWDDNESTLVALTWRRPRGEDSEVAEHATPVLTSAASSSVN